MIDSAHKNLQPMPVVVVKNLQPMPVVVVNKLHRRKGDSLRIENEAIHVISASSFPS